MSANKHLTVHLHLYQPPREDPWLGVIDSQPSASPFHDWNERITAECYHRLGHARILGEADRVVKLTNLYGASGISFNIGPTLLSWMKGYAPETLAAIVNGDKLSRERNNGHGNAVAQVYNHIIMPLANARDKETQVVWGIEAFRSYYGRDPEGMWLAETAVDTATLETLAANGIKFTILAPRQAKRWRQLGSGDDSWLQDGGVDPTRPYLCRLPSGKSIALFFYDGPISQAIAFEHLLDSGEKFRNRIMSGFDNNRKHAQHFTIGTDGESYGHHHRFGEMCLAWVLDRLESEKQIELTNYGNFLAMNPPQMEVQIHEASSWSCAHGVERWRSNCGCTFGEGQQEWRRPLRNGLDSLRDRLATIFEEHGGRLFKDVWAARNDYVRVLLAPSETEAFLMKHLKEPAKIDVNRRLAVDLLEMQHYGLLMFTSCAWFFDHISGIEALQNMRYAARAIQLADEVQDGAGAALERELTDTLATAPTNTSRFANGRELWVDQVKRLAVARQVESMLNDRLNTPDRVRKLGRLIEEARQLRIPLDRDKAQEQLMAAYVAEVTAAEGPLCSGLQAAFEMVALALNLTPDLLGWNEADFDLRHRKGLAKRMPTPRAVTADAKRRPHALWRQ